MATAFRFGRLSAAGTGRMIAAVAIGGVHYAMHGPLVSFNYQTYGLRSLVSPVWDLPAGVSGGPPAVGSDLKQLISETRQYLSLSPTAKHKLEFRTAAVPVPDFVGSGHLHKSYVVLPDYVNVTCISDLRSNTLNDYLKNVYDWQVPRPEMWLSAEGKLLVDSFVLSDKAKKFLIARQAYVADNDNVMRFTAVVTLLVYIFYMGTDTWKKMTRAQPQTGPGGMLAPVLVLSTLIYVTFNLVRYIRYQGMYADADAKAITCGEFDAQKFAEARLRGESLPVNEDFFSGAVEFYSKDIQRNQSLRQMMSSTVPWYKRGNAHVSKDGDYSVGYLVYIPQSSRCLRRLIAWKTGNEPK